MRMGEPLLWGHSMYAALPLFAGSPRGPPSSRAD